MAEISLMVGTEDGLFEFGPRENKALSSHAVTAFSQQNGSTWAILDGRSLWRTRAGGSWQELASLDDGRAHCLLPAQGSVILGTSEAHVVRLEDGVLHAVESFDRVAGRDAWHTPWGGPPDTRSLCQDQSGTIYANVHVGGVVRSDDDGGTWLPTGLDIRADVHQVLAHPSGPLLVATAWGFGESRDGGHAWRFRNEGLHASYSRAVAVSNGTVFVTASRGPRQGCEAAVYRRSLDGEEPFAKCEGGLTESFAENIDTYCLAADASAVVFGTRDGSVFLSQDGGETWDGVASGLPAIRCVALGTLTAG